MQFTTTPLSGSYLIDLEPIKDERGFFARYFCEKEFADKKLKSHWVQINTSLSQDVATLRGLHYQRPPYTEAKVVRCLQGMIWDVIVDLRFQSDTFGEWFGAELSSENRTMMYVPEGFAHGFITLKPNTEILYLVSEFYSPESEGTLFWNDPKLNITWPLKPEFVSVKDSLADTLDMISPLHISLK